MKKRPHGGRPGRVAPGGVEQVPKRKSAWPRDTAEADQIYQTLIERSLPAADEHVNEAPKLPEAPMDFGAMREQFAQRGYKLTRSHRVHDGQIGYSVERWTGPRYFTRLSDLLAYLSLVTGAPV